MQNLNSVLNQLKSEYDFGIISFDSYLELANKRFEDKDWIKSIIVFIFPYQNKPHQSDDYLTAKFAYGKDYHLVVRRILNEIALKLSLEKYEVMTDVSFLNEKLCAYLAGLGTYGKHNLIISPKYGSNFVIGEIVTDYLFTEYDQPIATLCDSCNLCVESCPVKALDNGFNRRLCLSYLTQSKSKNFELFDSLEHSCYGCDICQDVCPLNQKSYKYDKNFSFNTKSLFNLNNLKNHDEKTYQEFYHDKTFNWIGYLKMLRNIIVLDVNNNNMKIEDLNYYQNLYKAYPWFYDHLEYLKGKIINGNN